MQPKKIKARNSEHDLCSPYYITQINTDQLTDNKPAQFSIIPQDRANKTGRERRPFRWHRNRRFFMKNIPCFHLRVQRIHYWVVFCSHFTTAAFIRQPGIVSEGDGSFFRGPASHFRVGLAEKCGKILEGITGVSECFCCHLGSPTPVDIGIWKRT